MKIKSAQFKAESVDPDTGEFEAIVSVFGTMDSYGDIVMPGAFTDTLADWKASGNPIPIYYSHRMDDPDFNIGWVLEAKEVEKGLWIKGLLDVADPSPTSKAPQVHRLLKGGRLSQFSFAYDVLEGGFETSDGEEFYALRKLKLYEVGPTPIGAHQDTELLAVKAAADVLTAGLAGSKVGKVAGKHLDSLRAAQEALSAVIAAAGGGTTDDEKASGHGGDKDEELPGAKSEDLRFTPSAVEQSVLMEIMLADAS